MLSMEMVELGPHNGVEQRLGDCGDDDYDHKQVLNLGRRWKASPKAKVY